MPLLALVALLLTLGIVVREDGRARPVPCACRCCPTPPSPPPEVQQPLPGMCAPRHATPRHAGCLHCAWQHWVTAPWRASSAARAPWSVGGVVRVCRRAGGGTVGRSRRCSFVSPAAPGAGRRVPPPTPSLCPTLHSSRTRRRFSGFSAPCACACACELSRSPSLHRTRVLSLSVFVMSGRHSLTRTDLLCLRRAAHPLRKPVRRQ